MATSSAVRRFFRTPKGLLIIVLAILVALAAPHEGIVLVAPGLASAVIVAGLIDVLILRRTRNAWEFPSGAVLTGLLVAMVLTPQEPWYVAACTSAVAILSKYLFRTRSANVFNPAALALVVTFYIFDTGQSWWGALPEITPLVVLFATGVFIADRVNKIPLVLIFLGTLLPAVYGHGVPGRPREGRRDLSDARSAGRPVFRVLHPDRSTDIAREVSRSARVWRDRRGRQLRGLRMGGRGLLSSRGRARGQRLGSLASVVRMRGRARGPAQSPTR